MIHGLKSGIISILTQRQSKKTDFAQSRFFIQNTQYNLANYEECSSEE